MSLDSKALLIEQKKRYRHYVKTRPLGERLRHLEELQQQSYEILRIRAANGGRPIPEGWLRWAEAQEDLARGK